MDTPPQVFLQTAGEHRLFAFYHLAGYTGLRRGELLNLQWEHIDLDGAEVRIVGFSCCDRRPPDRGMSAKGGQSRSVSIDPGTVQVLKDHRERQATERRTAGPH